MATATKTSLENKHFGNSDCFVIIAFSSHLLLLREHAANGLVEGVEVNIVIFVVLTTTRTRSSESFILCLYVKAIRAKQAKVHFAYFVRR